MLGCSVAQMVVRWLAVRQARIRISARHPMEVPPTEHAAVKIYGDGPQRMLGMNDYMDVCIVKKRVRCKATKLLNRQWRTACIGAFVLLGHDSHDHMNTYLEIPDLLGCETVHGAGVVLRGARHRHVAGHVVQ
jgi:hypothetical protein